MNGAPDSMLSQEGDAASFQLAWTDALHKKVCNGVYEVINISYAVQCAFCI